MIELLGHRAARDASWKFKAKAGRALGLSLARQAAWR